MRYADAETAAALGFAKGRPVVYTRTCYLDGKDRVVLLNEQYIDSERYMIRTGGHELRLDETEENWENGVRGAMGVPVRKCYECNRTKTLYSG